jgi:hypothetical protein
VRQVRGSYANVIGFGFLIARKTSRAHPCTPCIRRGDQNKCQWHVIEPVYVWPVSLSPFPQSSVYVPIYSDKYVSRAEYDELKARVDRLETLLHSRAQFPPSFAPQPGPEPSPSQAQQQQASSTRLPLAAVAPGQQGNAAPAPMLPYNPISPQGPYQTQGAGFPASLAGSSRPAAAGPKDYSALALRPPNSPTGRMSLPPLASLANGPAPFDGPQPPSRLPREHREHRELHHQPYAPLLPQPPLQQPLQQLHQQTKNYHAQTLTPLGERLRLATFLQGPAAVSRLHRHRSSSNCIRRLRLLRCGARCHRCHTPSAYHSHPLSFLGRQRSVVPSVRSENGSSPKLPVTLDGV